MQMQKPLKNTSLGSTAKMDDERAFWNLMYGLAKLCQQQLDDEILELYDQDLSPLGYSKICPALKQIIRERRTKDQFPSIRDIREKIDPVVDDQSQAVAVVAEIWKGVAEYGRTGAKWAEQKLSPLSWAVVRHYGCWANLCIDANTNNTTTFKAQLRQLAETVIKLSKAGQLDQKIPLPEKPNDQVAKLIGFKEMPK